MSDSKRSDIYHNYNYICLYKTVWECVICLTVMYISSELTYVHIRFLFGLIHTRLNHIYVFFAGKNMIYMHMHACIHTYTYIRTCINTFMWMSVLMQACLNTYTQIYIQTGGHEYLIHMHFVLHRFLNYFTIIAVNSIKKKSARTVVSGL